jgi:hypothetical protein
MSDEDASSTGDLNPISQNAAPRTRDTVSVAPTTVATHDHSTNCIKLKLSGISIPHRPNEAK